MEFDSQYRVLRTLSASGSLNSPHTQVSATWSKREEIPEIPGFETPSDYIGASVRVRNG